MILRKHNIFDEKQNTYIKNTLFDSSRKWEFQTSGENTINKFLLSPLSILENKFFLSTIDTHIIEYIQKNNLSNICFERGYINCHPAYCPGDWHIDNSSGFTVLYYPDVDENFVNCGGTEFVNFSIEPYIKNSLILFPGYEKHRAQDHTLKGKYRFSIAFKFFAGLTQLVE